MVQPMIAKLVLPALGGTPSVWNTCMVFFQAVLLAGYAYAHFLPARLGVRKQSRVHIVVMLGVFLLLLVWPLSVLRTLEPPGGSNPIPWLLWSLLITVGLPFFIISTSAPLLQKWFA